MDFLVLVLDDIASTGLLCPRPILIINCLLVYIGSTMDDFSEFEMTVLSRLSTRLNDDDGDDDDVDAKVF